MHSLTPSGTVPDPMPHPDVDSASVRLAVESSTDCIKVLSLDGSLEYMNEGGMCVMEIEEFGPFQGVCWPDFWRGEENAKANAALDEARGGRVGRFQGYTATAKGNERYWDVTVSPIPGMDGQVEKILSVSRDITAQKEAEEERERLLKQLEAERTRANEANALLREVTDNLPVRVAYVDRDFRYRFLNGEYARVFGRPTQDAVGRHVVELVGEAAFAQGKPLLERAFGGETVGQTLEIEYPFGRRWVETRFTPVGLRDGAAEGAVVQIADVTERVEAEQALAEREAHYRGLFESVDDGFCTFEMIEDEAGRSIDYRFIEVNDAFVALTGLTREVALGGQTMREIAPTHEQVWFDRYGEVARTGVPLRIEDEASALGRRYEIHAFRIGGEGSRTVGALFKDVTARYLAERELAERRRQLDRTLETADVATFDWDVPNDRVYGNVLLQRFFGIDGGSEGLSISNYLERVHPEDREATGAAIANALATGARYEAAYRVVGENDQERWVVARGDATLDSDGKPTRLSGVLVDVTETTIARLTLDAERERFDTVLRLSPTFVTILRGEELLFEYANPAYLNLVGNRPTVGLTLAESQPEAVEGGWGKASTRSSGKSCARECLASSRANPCATSPLPTRLWKSGY